MSTPKVYHATIICTPAYREWLRGKYQFSVKRQPVVGNIHSERLPGFAYRAIVLRFGYAW